MAYKRRVYNRTKKFFRKIKTQAKTRLKKRKAIRNKKRLHVRPKLNKPLKNKNLALLKRLFLTSFKTAKNNKNHNETLLINQKAMPVNKFFKLTKKRGKKKKAQLRLIPLFFNNKFKKNTTKRSLWLNFFKISQKKTIKNFQELI